MLLTQLVKDVSGVEAGVVAELARDDLESLGDATDDELFLASN